jgi:hypothetical protein
MMTGKTVLIRRGDLEDGIVAPLGTKVWQYCFNDEWVIKVEVPVDGKIYFGERIPDAKDDEDYFSRCLRIAQDLADSIIPLNAGLPKNGMQEVIGLDSDAIANELYESLCDKESPVTSDLFWRG